MPYDPTHSEFYMTRPYARSEMARVVLEAAQFAHVPTARVQDFATLYPIDCGWFDYETYTEWVGVQADDFLRAFAFAHGTLCPVCLTPLANDHPRENVRQQALLPGWVHYRGDVRRHEQRFGYLTGTDDEGAAHKECKWVGDILGLLCSYADWPCMETIAADGYRCHLLLDLFHEAETFLKRKVRYRRFRDFVAARRVPLRFNPRHVPDRMDWRVMQGRPLPRDVRTIPEDA